MGNDLRRYAKQTNFRLAVGFILILFIIGDGLIFVFYGKGAGLMGLICLVVGILPTAMILGALWVIDWVVKRNQ
jgi:hypothetical protein